MCVLKIIFMSSVIFDHFYIFFIFFKALERIANHSLNICLLFLTTKTKLVYVN